MVDVSDVFPDLKVFPSTYDDEAIITLRFDLKDKEKTPVIKFLIPRIDRSWPYDEFMPYDFSDEIWISVKKGTRTFSVTLDELKQAFALVIQEIEKAYQDRDGAIGWVIGPAVE